MTELWLGAGSEGPGEVRVDAEFASMLVAEAEGHLASCLRALCLLGRCGGLRPYVGAPYTAFAVPADAMAVVGTQLGATIEVDAMQTGAWYILRNMLEHPLDEALRPVRVRAGPQATRGWRELARMTEESEDDDYPSPATALPWPLEFVDGSFSKSRRALIEFGAEVRNEWFYALRDGVRAWGDVLRRGGFAAPLDEPWDQDCVMGAVQIFDAWTIECEVSCFEASETAWSVLANIVDCYAGSMMPIDRLRIE
ncbi:MAG: hypothetical protein JSR59_15130 [Proteobacteria bacterium]|nr:hypothetical protein [Pseudomonadota bacterium]